MSTLDHGCPRSPTDAADLASRLSALAPEAAQSAVWRPQLFDLAHPAGRRAMDAALAADGGIVCHDTLLDQLRELIVTRSPARALEARQLDALVDARLGGRPPVQYGTWVHYPWLRALVHVLAEPEYRELRSERNRHKITSPEQDRLRAARIGIVGLSAGQAAALTLAREGIGGEFRLADFDTVSLCNLNRLGAGAHQLGLAKTVLTARALFEIDPYLRVSLFPDGLHADNLGAFLLGEHPLSLVVEECDDLSLKISLREQARACGIPVVMETSDRGMVDVERFDREPERSVLHGLLGGVCVAELKELPARDKVPYVLKILGSGGLSSRTIASLLEINQTLSSWPQLASEVALGGALVADVARRILLDQFRGSGRSFVDIQELIRDRTAIPQPNGELSRGAGNEAGPGPSAADIRTIVGCGILAPSGGNSQPWRFHFQAGRLRCSIDARRAGTFLDFQRTGSYVALGAAVENIDLAAQALGLRVHIRLFPETIDRDAVCDLTFSPLPDGPRAPALLGQVSRRRTNRRLGDGRPLPAEDLGRLQSAAAQREATVRVLTSPLELQEMGAILGAADRLRFLSKEMHRDLMAELRFTSEDAEVTSDGLDLDTLELSAADRAAIALISSWEAMEFLRGVGGGAGLEQPSRMALTSASAVLTLTMPGVSAESYFHGGRALQHVWLTATSLGLAVHPMTAPLYLFARLERGDSQGLSQDERDRLQALRRRYGQLVDVPPGHAEVALLRLSYASATTARSRRRPLDDVLSFSSG